MNYNTLINRLDAFVGKAETADYYATVWLFRRGVYLTVLIYFLTLLPKAFFFFGPEALKYGYLKYNEVLGKPVRLLFTGFFGGHYIWFLTGLFVSLITGLVGVFQRFSAILVYFFAFNLINRAEHIMNGSSSLMWILLFYLLFMDENRKAMVAHNKLSFIGKMLDVFAVWIARIQICIVYLSAGVYKLAGETWLKGEAFYYSLHYGVYSHFEAAGFLFQYPYLMMFLNYSSLFYQLVFPVLVWFKKIKGKLMIIGVLFHIGTIFINGILDFGMIMIASYLIFADNDFAGRVRAFFSFKRAGSDTGLA